MVAETKKHPIVLWAQRENVLFLTVEVEDMKIKQLVVDGNKFVITGTKGDGSVEYEAEMELYAPVKGSERRQIATQRHVELVIPKEKEEWWPRILKTPAKLPWLKVDFNKWVDEDDVAEGGGEDFDFSNFGGNFAGMPGMGGAGMPGMGMGGDESDDSEADDDEEKDMPPLESVPSEPEGAASPAQ